ncbi:hypothetical protein D623_10006024 [Myotis brandtii]|uniref:Uncharacterized protein n=1 Tax=Myotis brandtii TaxID=109478 RepID=S7MRE8_MYOBR|nr:hypothetical protein D623_10006024 [Myotis brandtii]
MEKCGRALYGRFIKRQNIYSHGRTEPGQVRGKGPVPGGELGAGRNAGTKIDDRRGPPIRAEAEGSSGSKRSEGWASQGEAGMEAPKLYSGDRSHQWHRQGLCTREEDERERETSMVREKSLIDCLLHTPQWGYESAGRRCIH